MKKFSWFFACLFALTLSAQEKLVILGKSPNRYVVHTVSKGETLQAISNQFGQSVAKLSSFNKKPASSVLTIGEKLKIPVTEYNFLRVKGNDNNAPLYHITQKGENLYRISQAGKVTIASLKEWNNLKSDNLKTGQTIIIGFMVNTKASADIQKNAKASPAVSVAVIPDNNMVNKEIKQADAPAKEINANEFNTVQPKSSTLVPPVKAPLPKQQNILPAAGAVVIKEVPVQEKKAEISTDYIPKEGDEGYFATAYTEHGKDLEKQFHSGDAAVFKTISGWTDRKYYVLINDVLPETIVRITGPNNKSICAKVLGPLQETKGGAGLLLRMSNSAASTLGLTEAKFTVTVTYFE